MAYGEYPSVIIVESESPDRTEEAERKLMMALLKALSGVENLSESKVEVHRVLDITGKWTGQFNIETPTAILKLSKKQTESVAGLKILEIR